MQVCRNDLLFMWACSAVRRTHQFHYYRYVRCRRKRGKWVYSIYKCVIFWHFLIFDTFYNDNDLSELMYGLKLPNKDGFNSVRMNYSHLTFFSHSSCWGNFKVYICSRISRWASTVGDLLSRKSGRWRPGEHSHPVEAAGVFIYLRINSV